MELLWAPWRGSYVENLGKSEGCFLCEALLKEPSKENLVLKVFDKAFVIMNKYPYNSGHLMVVPKRHISHLKLLTKEESLEIFELTNISLEVLSTVLKPDGFNLGFNLGRASGAGLETHIHEHIVPRWVGDTNFMPTIAKTKVLSQSLEELYDRMKPEFDKF